ncbi:MAG: BTAD domain-containing putative transcriptional regulator [Chloroflexota bacterium]
MDTKLYLFGSPRLERNEETVPLTKRKALALLAYLAVTEKIHARDALATLLWPEFGQKAARTYLRQHLAPLRELLGKQTFVVDRETIGLNSNSALWSDVATFRQHVTDARQCSHPTTEICTTCLPLLTKAVTTYSNDFLVDFFLTDTTEFDDWQFFQREGLRQTLAEVLQQLIQSYAAQSNFDQAIPYARRWVGLDPLHEPAQCQLMLLYAHAGQQAAALRQYETYVSTLEEELGISPEAETTELYEAIRTRQLGKVAGLQPPTTTFEGDKSGKIAEGQQNIPSPPHLSSPPFQATATLPHFVGRSEEIEQVCGMLNEVGTSVVALVGMGGLGKTTLATQIAHTIKDDLPDGVLWANPAISSVMDILDNWGRAYGYDFSGLADIESRSAAVRGVLADKSVLLVLDNVTRGDEVQPLFAGGERCSLLLTTRDLDVAHALNAQVLLLGELSAEGGRELLVNILGEERVAAEEEDAAKIGRLLHYLPLAMEIVAQRLKSRAKMKLEGMVARLTNAQQRLGLKISNRAVRTSFEVSWEALDEELRMLFPLLAVFEGRPFSLEALAYIADLDPFDVEDALFELTALSLVKEDEEEYYRQHPLLADFAMEKLAKLPYRQHELLADLAQEKLSDSETAYRRMVAYYLNFAAENQQKYEALESEWGNMGAAIRIAHEQEKWQEVIEFTDVLEKSWLTRARYVDAREAYGLAQDAAIQLEDETLQATNLLRWGEVCTELGDHQEAKQHLSKSLQKWMGLEEDAGVADAHYHLARIALERGDYVNAEQLMSSSYSIRELIDDIGGLGNVQYLQAYYHFERGDLNEAEGLLENALINQERANERTKMISTLRFQGEVAVERRIFDQAASFFQQAEALCLELQDKGELAMIYYAMAINERRKKNFQAARSHAESAIALFRRFGLKRFEGMMLYHLSAILNELEDYSSALSYNLESVKICEATNNVLGKLFAMVLLGDLYQTVEQPQKSRAIWQEAQQIAQRLNQDNVQEQLRERLAYH